MLSVFDGLRDVTTLSVFVRLACALICGGIGAGARLALEEAGIRLYPGAAGSADEAVRAFLAGTLSYQPDLVCSHHKDTPPRVCGSHTCSAACYHEKTEEIRNEPN